MSQTDEVDVEKYRSTAGADPSMSDISSDEHALKQQFGDDEDAKSFEYEAELMGERVAQWYDDPAAALREYLSNAETAEVRRAKMELKNAGLDVPDEVTQVLQKAKETCDYEPVIEVTHRKKPESTSLTIEDNGCGITTTEYLVLKKIGYSASHADGDRLGQFGMGFMSGFQLTGVENPFKMQTRSYPCADQDREENAYSLLAFVTNFEYLDQLRDGYGTRFDFPNFSEKASDIDVRGKIDEFAEGMRVPVLYREFDESGTECYNEDYLPTALETDYPDDELTVVYEDEFFKAVMSPVEPEGRSYVTYNISMPIRRNTSGFKDRPTYNAPWTWDFRGKVEDGPIVVCESDDSVVGKTPIASAKYERLPDERQEDAIPRSEVPDDAIVMPTPASSRDSYEGGHDEFWTYVSKRLMEAWGDIAADRFDALDNWSDFETLDDDDRTALLRAYDQFGPATIDNEPSTVQEEIEDGTGVTVPESVCKRLDLLQREVRVVDEGCDRPHYKRNTSPMKIWEVLDEYETVYMAKSISKRAAEIVWGLEEPSALVRIDDDASVTERYETYGELYGWTPTKKIPRTGLTEKLPSLDDDVANEWEDTSATKNTNSSGGSRTSRNPKSKRITIRHGTNSPRRMSSSRAGEVYDELDNGGSVKMGSHATAEILMLYKETEISGSAAPTSSASKRHNIGVSAVPNYVYKYLKDADNVITDSAKVEERVRQNARNKVDVADTVLAVDSNKLRNGYNTDELADIAEDNGATIVGNSISVIDADVFSGYYWSNFIEPDTFDSHIVGIGVSGRSTNFCDETVNVNATLLKLEERTPDWVDVRSGEFCDYMDVLDPKYVTLGADQTEIRLDVLHELDDWP